MLWSCYLPSSFKKAKDQGTAASLQLPVKSDFLFWNNFLETPESVTLKNLNIAGPKCHGFLNYVMRPGTLSLKGIFEGSLLCFLPLASQSVRGCSGSCSVAVSLNLPLITIIKVTEPTFPTPGLKCFLTFLSPKLPLLTKFSEWHLTADGLETRKKPKPQIYRKRLFPVLVNFFTVYEHQHLSI